MAPAGTFFLQIGSFENEAQADSGFRAFRSRLASFGANLSQNVQRVDLGAKGGIRYRLRVGPYADRAAAVAACETLKGQGGSCLVASP